MNKLQEYQKHITSYFGTIDPGARINGGTGFAFFSITQKEPIQIADFSSLDTSLYIKRSEWILHQLENRLNSLMLLYGFHSNKIPIFIEEPQFFDTHKGQTAAKGGDLAKLIFMYGRLYDRIYKTEGCFPVPLRIIDWKGQLPKANVLKRIEKILKKKYTGDSADAVGMGLYLKGLL